MNRIKNAYTKKSNYTWMPFLLTFVLVFMACTEGSLPVSNDTESLSEGTTMMAKKAADAPNGLILNEFNGNYYQAVDNPGVTWQEAFEATEDLEFKGCKGHLATITSQNESDWVVANINGAVTGGYWFGGKQASGTTDPAEGWSWVTGENWLYTNWFGGEPNDFGGTSEEESLHFLPSVFGGGDGGWNDQAFDNIGYDPGNGDPFVFASEGYLVEYDCGAKVTGSGNRDGDKPRISFVAQKDVNNQVKGQAQVNYPDGRGSFHIAVSCLSVWGNKAWVGGTVTNSTFEPYQTGTEVIWSVADNGQGKDTNDATSFYVSFLGNLPIADQCALQGESSTFIDPVFESTTGNIKIH